MVTVDHCDGYENGAVVYHPIIAIEGSLRNQLQAYIEITNQTSGETINWPVVSSKFKSFVLLKNGLNVIVLRHGFYSKELNYTFTRKQSPYIVQPLYIIARDEAGEYQAPKGADNSARSACERISLNTALLQTFTAMNMKAHNLGAHTFQLPLNTTTNLPICALFNSKYSREQLYAMSERELWRNLAREIIESGIVKDTRHCKFLAFLSCTRFSGEDWTAEWRHKDIIGATQGHIALGGGGLAVLGTGTLHTWSDSLRNLVSCFTDDTVIDRSLLMDDSAYRGSYWANYATGIGAALHELGHTFDLSHTESGIMSRGFDNIHLFFVLADSKPVEQPTSAQNDKLIRLQQQLKAMSAAVSSDQRPPADSACMIVQSIDFVSRLSLPASSSQSSVSSQGSLSQQSCSGQWTQPAALCDSSDSSKSPPVFPCFQLPFFSEPPLTIKTGKPTEHLSLSATPDDSCHISPAHNQQPVQSPTGNVSVSTWSHESAVMMRYSRWLMTDGEISTNSKTASSSSKQTIINGFLELEEGIIVIQVYLLCLDQIHTSYYYYRRSDAAVTSVHIQSLKLNKLRHKSTCDNHTTCVSLHIRDYRGKLHQINMV